MNQNNHPVLGIAITSGATIISWLPTVNIVMQIIAAAVAIIVGLVTLRKQLRKEKKHK